MERDDRRPRPEDRPPAPTLHRAGAARLRAGRPALTGEADSADLTPARWRRFKITFVAGGIAAAAAAIFLALFRGVTIETLVGLPGMLHFLGGVLLILVLSTLVSIVNRVVRGVRPRGPFRYRAWPADDDPLAINGLIAAKLTVHLAHLIAITVTGLVAIATIPFDGPLAAGLVQAFLLVVVGGTLAKLTLTAAGRIERLVRWMKSLRWPISQTRP